ncbi:MAG TPA: hypothetical protein VIK93_10175 [Limnochordales bacterium]
MTALQLATHWTSGGQLPKEFLIIMLGVTYALILLLGIGAYRLLKGTGGDHPPDEPGTGTGPQMPPEPGRDGTPGRGT